MKETKMYICSLFPHEMKFLKKHKSNILFVGFILVIFFTPLGFHFKVFVSRYLHFSPSEIPAEKQIRLSNYNWNLVNTDRNPVDFNRFKNKVIIVNFWATWCPPCVAEMPSFQKLYEAYKSEVVFLFVANDNQEKVTAFLESNHYTFPVYYEVSNTPTEITSSSLPATYIIDKNGNIVLTKTGSTNWNSDFVRGILDKYL